MGKNLREGREVYMRRRVLWLALLVVPLVLFGKLINNPFSDPIIEFTSTTTTAKEFYTTYPEYYDPIWTRNSRVMMFTQPVVDEMVSDYAEHAMLDEEERLQEQVMTEISLLINGWNFAIGLCSPHYPLRNYIKLDSSDCEVIRIILLNDKGYRVTPKKIESNPARRYNSETYYVSNIVRFPEITSNMKSIIDKDTQWIEIWLFTATKKIGFRYDFY